MRDAHGRWIPDLSPKGYEVFNDYHRFLLLHGSRKSSKSISAENKLCRHAFENQGAIVAVIAKTIKNAKSSGVWQDLIRFVVPHWINANIGFKYIVPPRSEPDTKMAWFSIRNIYGGESIFQLHSLEHAAEAEAKFKGTRFSMVYLSECDQFEDRLVFDILSDQLRVIGIPYEQHQLIADTNPPEEGEDHWLHSVWWKQLQGDNVSEGFRALFREMNFCLNDNPFLDPREKAELEEKYRYDENKYARFVLGKWVRDDSGGIFEKFFIPNIHVRGTCEGPSEDDWEVIVPPKNCIELYTGWDMGDVNHAAVICTKRDVGEHSAFDVIDELVVLDRQISVPDFAEAFLEKMDYWERFMRDNYGTERVLWRHWSDASALRYRSAADSSDELIVRQVSKNRIILNCVAKPKGSVKQRVSLLKKLLFEKRLFVSAQCRAIREMLLYIKPGKTKAEPVQLESQFKHAFDALTYLLSSESPMDVESRIEPATRPKLISV
jgi:PBSX family phage terminase large subunit